VKVGDLVKFVACRSPKRRRGTAFLAKRRRRGIVVSFDEDDDPIVMWLCSPSFTEPNFRSHLSVLSEAL
jgi:hypothetical protein